MMKIMLFATSISIMEAEISLFVFYKTPWDAYQ